MAGQLRVLTLNQGENQEVTLYRLEKGWTLHFVLGPSLSGKNVRLFVNHPTDAKSGPNRTLFRELVWNNYSEHKSDVYDNYAEVPVIMAGSFNYFFTIDGSEKRKNVDGCGCFLVDPILRIGKYDEKLPLDCITCQTVLPKSLGLFPEWHSQLQVAKECNYNMIHFTPVQELGASNSAYSLADQLKLNSVFSPPDGRTYTMEDVRELVNYMKDEWEILSLTDLVYNHTANESHWIQEHPECVYNVVNSPHLKPAYLLDRILWHFTLEIGNGHWANEGVPPEICTEDHLNNIQRLLRDVIFPKHKIHEYYLVHIDDIVTQFRTAVISCQKAQSRKGDQLEIIADPSYRRLKATVDLPLALFHFNTDRPGANDEGDRINQCCWAFRQKLEELNGQKYNEVQSHLEAAITNVLANARWRFLDPNGPRVGLVTPKEPVMYNYFLLPKEKLTVDREEELMHTGWGNMCMAHNGWVMGDDPLRNFAEAGSNVYLRRELIPWGDSVKLRYGKRREDCPFLWDHMREYTVMTASIFHGVRLDNCHSTPIHVAEYMLDEARKVRPDLYVIAELFTSSEHMDNVFINRLGLNSLIREALSAWDSHEEGRLVHRYGGYPVGAFIQPPARPLMPSLAHAIFFDQTHDNPSPVEKRCSFDPLPSAALVAMACCATGSNRGFDELVPHHINVVTESRMYNSWTDNAKAGTGTVNIKSGILAAKKALNKMHQELGAAGFNQVYVDQVDADIVSVTRHNPVSHQSVIMVARTAFRQPDHLDTGHVPPLCVPGIIDEVILEAKGTQDNPVKYQRDLSFINGLPEYYLQAREHIKIQESGLVELRDDDNKLVQEVDFINFPPGSIIALRISLNSPTKQAILGIRSCLSQFGYRMHTYSGRNLRQISSTELDNIAVRLSFDDLNRALFHCGAEERDDGKGIGAYNIPGFGDLPYCGLQGVMSVLSKIRSHNDLGHPICENLRNGDWLPNYLASRLIHFTGTKKLGQWLQAVFNNLSRVPRYLIPCYFDAIVTGVFIVLEDVAWAKMTEFMASGSSFVRKLGLATLQFCSACKTAPLPALSPSLAPPCPPTTVHEEGGPKVQSCITIAAGLPHFSSGIFRSWGRDTFIALRGCLLLTGRYEDARFMILGYAACLRHGLIPNLLGEGTAARYNCRDAVWWWLQCIQDYCNMVPEGINILKDTVSRLYPTDDCLPETPGSVDQPLHDVIQEAMQRHADGVKYRERNAGPAIDRDMTNEGFNSEIGIDWDTGLVFGGNVHNCGTWMDKMGSSDYAGNKGKPATPRDGSAVELVGLSKSTVRWLAHLSSQGQYPFDGITRNVNGQNVKVTFSEWNKLIQQNFEKYFWVNTSPVPEDEPKPELINRRGIYKDSHNATQFWADYQLRPNVPIAMVVAPEMFNPEHAWSALINTREVLLGPLAMRTLDPSDWAYNPWYINSDQSNDPSKAQGFNYHQGPEWVWPLGFFLRASLHFAHQLDKAKPGLLDETINFIRNTLSGHNVYIQASDWKSLPELTNKDGQECHDSCPAQAWSIGCILEVMFDLERLSRDSTAVQQNA